MPGMRSKKPRRAGCAGSAAVSLAGSTVSLAGSTVSAAGSVAGSAVGGTLSTALSTAGSATGAVVEPGEAHGIIGAAASVFTAFVAEFLSVFFTGVFSSSFSRLTRLPHEKQRHAQTRRSRSPGREHPTSPGAHRYARNRTARAQPSRHAPARSARLPPRT